MNKNSIGILVIVLILLLAGWYYFANKSPMVAPAATTVTVTPAPTTSTQPASTLPPGGMETGTVNGSATVTTAPQKEIAITGTNFSFSPKTISVKKGDHVKITFTSTSGMHDFSIDEFNVHSSRINGGESTVVEFDATKAGTFQYYCSVGNHRAMGMVGTLTVTQ